MPPTPINSLSISAFRFLSRNTLFRATPPRARHIPSIPLSAIRHSSHSSPNQTPLPQKSASSTPRNGSVPGHHKKPAFAVPPPPDPPKPEYEMTFTCTPCSTRSTHRISKQGYHFGSVLITCPECRNRHIISDHLNIFGDRDITIEDIMRERGQIIKKGTLSEDGDVEFWEDNRENSRSNPRSSEPVEPRTVEDGT